MLTTFLLTMLNSPAHNFFAVVHHIASGMQWYTHCSRHVILPRHFRPHKYGAYQYDGQIVWSCKFWDRAGTMHPAYQMLHHLVHAARHVGRLFRRH